MAGQDWNFSLVSIVLFFVSVLVSLIAGMMPFSFLQPDDLSNYLSRYNSLRIGRGVLWAVLLLPFWIVCFLQDRQSACRHVMTGFVIGVIGVCMIVFWERGVISDILYATNRYDLFRSLLDFSSEYRITALFSEMNTGGTAIDGYIALAWVFPLGAYFIWLASLKRQKWTGDCIPAVARHSYHNGRGLRVRGRYPVDGQSHDIKQMGRYRGI